MSEHEKELLKMLKDGKIPIREDCILHGNRLNVLEARSKHTEKNVEELHDIYFKNGHQMKVSNMALQIERNGQDIQNLTKAIDTVKGSILKYVLMTTGALATFITILKFIK